MEDDLTIEEMLSIIKAVVAWNSSSVQFDTGYLKYANEIKLDVVREGNTITLVTKLPKIN